MAGGSAWFMATSAIWPSFCLSSGYTVDKVLFDFGASSAQFDDTERGFSYWSGEAPLDMRMDRSQGQSAADLVNSASL